MLTSVSLSSWVRQAALSRMNAGDSRPGLLGGAQIHRDAHLAIQTPNAPRHDRVGLSPVLGQVGHFVDEFLAIIL